MLLCQAPVHAESFVVKDIRIEGLERISPGTVFNYLPVKAGDEFDESRTADAVRALFKTGFFRDVRLERDGDVLVVIVSEREGIASITITGNKDIKTEALMEGLKQIGFSEGGVYDRSLLDKVEQELRRQYFSQGKYGLKIDSKVKKLGGNRVGIELNLSEGRAAKIKEINIVGNKSYTDDELIRKFKLTTPTLFSFFTKSDQYSKQKLGADLETLRSYYLDNGFINFNIDSTQVSITPDKSDIYITVNVTEGDRYTVSGVKLAGNLIVPQEELFPLVKTLKGAQFSRKEVTETSTSLSERLGDEGYAFANVNAVPDINNDNKTVAITYFVDPGKRTYVRRINFAGNTKTRDEVLRREMRQMEGGWIATTKVNRSKERLQRLGFFEEVNVETPAVPGANDQVDVNYSVTERPAGNLLLGLGFSQTQGLIFNTSVTQDNFLGSGKRVQFAFNNSDVNRQYALGYLNPYYTDDGISRGFNLSYRETNAAQNNIARFNTNSFNAGVNFGIPVTEFQNVNVGVEFERTELQRNVLSSQKVQDFIDDWSDEKDRATFNVFRLTGSFAYDTRNKALLPDRGTLHRIRGEVGVPVIDLSYYKVDYDAHWYYPLSEDYTLALRGEVGYCDGYGNTKNNPNKQQECPFFERFYAGGPRSIRGFKENTLGPKDETDNSRSVGGNLKIIGNAEVILPVPFVTDVKSIRLSAFVDAGNVYDTLEDCEINTNNSIKCSNAIRMSAGLSGIWLSPFGVLSVSIAQPINKQEGDQSQPFQFTFGTNF
jgi:outer membrane protein insertion porin family